MDYESFYERISRPYRENDRLHAALIYFNMYFTYTMYLLYPCLLVMMLFARRELFLKTLLIPAAGFYVLSEVRRRINRSRPYEKYDLDILLKKETKGCSMPSRHVFSAVVIAMGVMLVSETLGIVLLVLCAVSCAVRVLLGVHYPIDVVIGYLCGILTGMILHAL
jgi:membrane-associated phospholipid phosphatase